MHSFMARRQCWLNVSLLVLAFSQISDMHCSNVFLMPFVMVSQSFFMPVNVSLVVAAMMLNDTNSEVFVASRSTDHAV